MTEYPIIATIFATIAHLPRAIRSTRRVHTLDRPKERQMTDIETFSQITVQQADGSTRVVLSDSEWARTVLTDLANKHGGNVVARTKTVTTTPWEPLTPVDTDPLPTGTEKGEQA